jgi:hypothetical protein
MKVQVERPLQEAGALGLSAGLSRPDQGLCDEPEADQARQESHTETATIPCAGHCKASLILWRVFSPPHV